MEIHLTEAEKARFIGWQYSEAVPSAYAIRAKALISVFEGHSVSATAKSLGYSRKTVYKWLHRFISGDPDWFKGKSTCPHRMPMKLSKSGEAAIVSQVNALLSENTRVTAKRVRTGLLMQDNKAPSLTTIQRILNDIAKQGFLLHQTNIIQIDNQEEYELLRLARYPSIPSTVTQHAKIVLLNSKGASASEIASQLGSSKTIVGEWLRRYEQDGIEGLYPKKAKRARKDQDPIVKNEVFALLHSPPTDHGINRTSWTIYDLKKCLANRGLIVSEAVISRVIKLAGYRWRKAREVLTSPDPNYHQKLAQIKRVLSKLGDDERFFSIDEFGPCAIRKRGGRKLVAPGQEHFVLQFQRSKGHLIITAALEMSTNQVTYIYSERKNTDEIIRLTDELVQKYSNVRTLYFSWDAASWHDSKRLKRHIKKHNGRVTRMGQGPKIVLAPLPKSAQFLNVIESVFSGLAKAVIHNSDYDSKQSAMQAIDRYFLDRNEHYRLHPRKAGKKIWGSELVPAEFDETQNCKDPRWR